MVLGRFSDEVRHPDTAAAWRALLLADRWEAASADLSTLRDAVASVASIRSGQLRAGVAHLLWSAHVRIRTSALTALVEKVKRRPQVRHPRGWWEVRVCIVRLSRGRRVTKFIPPPGLSRAVFLMQNKACLEAVGVKAREVTTFLDHAVAVLELAVRTDDHDGNGPGPYRGAGKLCTGCVRACACFRFVISSSREPRKMNSPGPLPPYSPPPFFLIPSFSQLFRITGWRSVRRRTGWRRRWRSAGRPLLPARVLSRWWRRT